MKDWLPEGYQPHEIPPDYSGPLFLEYQMGYAFEQGRDSVRAEMQDLNIRLGLEIGRKNEEIERLKAEVEQLRKKLGSTSQPASNL